MEKITPLLVAIFIAVLGVGAGVGYVAVQLHEVNAALVVIDKSSSRAESNSSSAASSAEQACENTSQGSSFSCR